MRALTRRWLEKTQGLVEVEEGEKLAELASQVTANHAIVEAGSRTGSVPASGGGPLRIPFLPYPLKQKTARRFS